jgi:leucyl aminopeptidase
MQMPKLWQPVVAVILLLTASHSQATRITFSESSRSDTFATVLFQFYDQSINSADNLDQTTQAQLAKAAELYTFKGKLESNMSVVASTTANTQQIVVIGLGYPEKLGRAEAVAVGGKIAQLFTRDQVQKIDIVVNELTSKMDAHQFATHIAHGVSLGSYRFNRYLQHATQPNNDYRIVVTSETAANQQYERLRAVENGVFLARDLVNTNGAELTPVTFIDQAKQALKGLDVELDIYSAKKIKQMNMGLLYAVGKGSVPGSRLIVARYQGSDDQPIALVGKGVTFDTGGYNIKTHKSIALMKGDMSGAAAVLGTVKALAEQKAKVNLIAVLPLAENMVSETALLPGDIIRSMSGKSVEIINTDAEGRLIMADDMWYVQQQYQPQIMLNIATLTGAKIRAVGTRFAALFSDDEQLINQLIRSGRLVNEPLWRLPLAYGDKLKSTLADTANVGSDGPGASTATMFLKQFVQQDTRWAHIDISGRELANTTNNEVPAGGVGYGVRLLVDWLSTAH